MAVFLIRTADAQRSGEYQAAKKLNARRRYLEEFGSNGSRHELPAQPSRDDTDCLTTSQEAGTDPHLDERLSFTGFVVAPRAITPHFRQVHVLSIVS